MTRRRSSPLGLELVKSAMLVFMLLPLLTQAAPLQDMTEMQQYTEGCYYNYNHYNEGDRILTNEPCLNCTCHNKMLMCYLRVCPFTKPIGHDCIVEKREDQCCPIITCPEVPVDVAHHNSEPGTELSIPEKYGCSIDERFYPEGAQVPSNPNKPCELCYCIKNRTSCLMQECTLHIDGCQPIYNKGSCCPVRYNCDHENDVLELEDHSTSTTTTVRPTPGFILTTTMTPAVSTDCIHNDEVYADGSSILGKNPCEHCYCMRGDIVCAVQECEMPMLAGNGKSCHPLPASEGECCPSNYVCEDDTATTTDIADDTTILYIEDEMKLTTTIPIKDLHSSVSVEDLQLQKHIDDDGQLSTELPERIDQSRPIAEDKISSDKLGVTSSPVTSDADRKHEELPATTVSGVSDEDILSIVTTLKTPSNYSDENIPTTTSKLSEEESSSVHVNDEDKYESTTVNAFAFDTETEKSEEDIEKDLSEAEEEEDTMLDHTTDKLSHSDDGTMSSGFTTEKTEIMDDKEDEAHVSSDKPIEAVEFTTGQIETKKEEEEEDNISVADNEYTSYTTARTTDTEDLDTTTVRTVSIESNGKIDTSTSLPSDIPQKSEQTTEQGGSFDVTSSKIDAVMENETEVPTAENVENITKQPAIEEDTDKAQEEEGSGADEKDLEIETTPAISSDEAHPLDDRKESTSTTQKTPSVSDRKEDSDSVVERITESEIESTTASTAKPTADVHDQTTTTEANVIKPEDKATIDLNDIKNIEDESIADHTTILPAVSDEKITSTSTDASLAADSSYDTHKTPTVSEETDKQGEGDDIYEDKGQEMIDQITELATDSYPSSSIASIPEEHKNKKDELTTISSADINTPTEHPSGTNIVPSTTATTVPDKHASDIEQTTQGHLSPDDSTSDTVYDMEIIPTAIPGEGDCLVNQKTYKHNSVVPLSDECDHSCNCLNSIVVCQPVHCQIPENVEKCTLKEKSTDKCCPAYICEMDSATEKPEDVITEVNDEVQKTTSPGIHDSSSNATIGLPVDKSDEALSGVLPTDIDMPTITTEEPMSHVKVESSNEQIPSTTKIPKPDTTSSATESTGTASTHDKEKPFGKPDENIDRTDVTLTTPASEEIIKPQTADTTLSHKPADEQSMINTDVISATTQSAEVSMKPHEADKTKPADEQLIAQSTISPSSAVDMASISDIDDLSSGSEDSTTKLTVSPVQEQPSSITESPDTVDEEGNEFLTSTPSIQVEKLGSKDDSLKQGMVTPSDSDIEAETTTSTVKETVEKDLSTQDEHSLEQTSTPSDETVKESIHDIPATTQSSETETENNLPTSVPTFDGSLTVEKDEKITSPTAETEDESTDETLSHTTLPFAGDKYADAVEETTHAPTLQDKTVLPDEQSPQTTASSVEAYVPMSSTNEPMVEDDIENIDIEIEEAAADGTLKPSTLATIDDDTIDDKLPVITSSDDNDTSDVIPNVEDVDEPIDITLFEESVPEDQTNGPLVTEHMPTIVPSSTDDKKTNNLELAHTTLPYLDLEKGSTTENILSQTIVPSTVNKDSSENIQKIPPRKVSPSVEGETETFEDGSTSQSSADKVKETTSPQPAVSDKDFAQTTIPSVEDKTQETTDESLLPSTIPAFEDDKSQSLPPLYEDKRKDTDALSFTVSPTVIDDVDRKVESESHTVAPMLESDIKPIDTEDKKVDEVVSQTVAPAVESDIQQIDVENKKDGPVAATMSHTVAPDLDKRDEETLSQTVATALDSDMEKIDVEDIKHDGIDETLSQTVAPAIESDMEQIDVENKNDETVNETLSHTVVPELDSDIKPIDAVDKKDYESVSQTLSPVVDSITEQIDVENKTDEAVNDTQSHTVVPEIDSDLKPIDAVVNKDDETVSQTVAPAVDIDMEIDIGDEKDDDTVDEIVSHTVAPVVDNDNEPIDEEDKKADSVGETVSHTIAPDADEDMKRIVEEDKKVDESLAHTISPVVDENIKPIDAEDNKEDEPVPHTVDIGMKPIDDEDKKTDESLSHTVAPNVDENLIPIDDEEKTTETPDETLPYTVVPTLDDENKMIDGDKKTTDSLLDHGVVPSTEADEKQIIDESVFPTVLPAIQEEEDKKIVNDTQNQTITPSTDDAENVDHATVHATIADDEYLQHSITSTTESTYQSIDEMTVLSIGDTSYNHTSYNHTIAPVAEGEEQTKKPLSHTVAPVVENEKVNSDNDNDKSVFMEHTVVPSDILPESTTFSTSDDENNKIDNSHVSTYAPTSGETEKESTDASILFTLPVSEDETSDEYLPQATSSPVLSDTLAPTDDVSNETIDDNLTHTISPLVAEKTEETISDSMPTTLSPLGEIAKKPMTATVDYDMKIIEDDLPSVIVPTQDTMKMESGTEPMHSTISPLNGDTLAHTSLPIDEQGKKTTDGTLIQSVPPSYEGMTTDSIGDSMSQTIAPAIKGEMDSKDESVPETTSPLSDVTSQENVVEPLVESVTIDKNLPSHTITPVDEKEEEKDTNANTTDYSVEDDKKYIMITPIVGTDNLQTISPSKEPAIAQDADDISGHTSTSEIEKPVTVSVVAPQNVSEVDIDDESLASSTPSIQEEDVMKESFDDSMSQTVGPIERETTQTSVEHTVTPTESLILEHEGDIGSTHPSVEGLVHDADKKHIDKSPTESEVSPTDGVDFTTPSSVPQDKESQTEIDTIEPHTDKTNVMDTVTSSTPIPDTDGTSEHSVFPHMPQDSTVTTLEPHTVEEKDDQGTTIPISADIEIEKETIPPFTSAEDEIHTVSEVESMPSSSTKKPTDQISETTAHGSFEGQHVSDVTSVPIFQEQNTSISVDKKPAKEQDSTTVGTVSAKPDDDTITVVPTSTDSDLQTNVPAKDENVTAAPAVVADLNSTEETEDSVESEEELTTDPNSHKIQHVGQFVTDRGDDATTEIPLNKIHEIKHDEPKTSSEEESEEHIILEDKEPSITTIQPSVQSTSAPPMYDVMEEDKKHESTEKPFYPEDQDVVQITQIMPVGTTAEPDSLHVDIDTTTTKQEKHHASETTVEKEVTTPHSLEETDDETVSNKDNITEKTESSEESNEEKESAADVPASTSVHPLLPHHDISTTSEPIRDTSVDHQSSAAVNETTVKATEKLLPTTTSKTTTTTSEAPISTSAPSTQYSQPPPSYGGQPPQYPSYPEDEYTDEDETEVFGPGTCRYGGKLFVSAQQIPRDDPCDFCFCFRSDIICLQQSCPPPISGCHEEPINGFCCPRYECPVSMATVLNITTSTTTTSTTLPPHFLHHAYEGAAAKNGCHINGKSYRVGENIDSTSGPCMHCTCGGDGQMKCDPKTCSPEPMLRQMIAVVASRRR